MRRVCSRILVLGIGIAFTACAQPKGFDRRSAVENGKTEESGTRGGEDDDLSDSDDASPLPDPVSVPDEDDSTEGSTAGSTNNKPSGPNTDGSKPGSGGSVPSQDTPTNGGSTGGSTPGGGTPTTPAPGPVGNGGSQTPPEPDETQNAAEYCYKEDQRICDIEKAVVAATNELRAKVGKAPLKFSVMMGFAAQEWSKQQASRGSISHSGFPSSRMKSVTTEFSSTTGLRILAENVALGTTKSSASAESIGQKLVDMWESSSGHYKNMVSGSYTAIGAGVWISGSRVYGTQIFGKDSFALEPPSFPFPSFPSDLFPTPTFAPKFK